MTYEAGGRAAEGQRGIRDVTTGRDDSLVEVTGEVAANGAEDVDEEVPPDTEANQDGDGRSDPSSEPHEYVEEVVGLGLQERRRMNAEEGQAKAERVSSERWGRRRRKSG